MSLVDIKYSAIGGAEAPIKLAPKPKYVDDDADSDEDDDVGSYNEDDNDDNDNDNDNDNEHGAGNGPSSVKPKLGSQKGLPSKKISKSLRDDDDDDEDDDDNDDDDSYYDEDDSDKNDDDDEDDVDNDDDDDAGMKRSKSKRGKRGADNDDDDDDNEVGADLDDDEDDANVSDDEGAVHDDDDADDDDGQDGEKYKKINFEFRKNYITDTHPEVESHTDDEIHALAKVVRNKAGIIVDPLHKTTPLLTKYEKTRILGIRTKQLNNGATPYVSSKAVLGLGNTRAHQAQVIDGYAIAVRELEEKKLPFIIRRPLPNGGTEYWYLQDLEVL